MINMDEKYKSLIDLINEQKPYVPEIAIVLGSGLGDFAKNINLDKSIPTSSLPNYPKSTVQGHEGYIHFAEVEGKKLLLFQGRIHFYEGYKIYECLLPMYIASKLDVKYALLTNAAGGINDNIHPGDLMLITSFNALSLKKELSQFFTTPSIEQKKMLNDFPSKEFAKVAISAALEEKVELKQGVYYFSKGPSYETPAEIKMMANTGSDAVGMSTAHEALYAALNGIKVIAISCITNYAAGISPVKLSHAEVMETADMVKEKFERLVKRIISSV